MKAARWLVLAYLVMAVGYLVIAVDSVFQADAVLAATASGASMMAVLVALDTAVIAEGSAARGSSGGDLD